MIDWSSSCHYRLFFKRGQASYIYIFLITETSTGELKLLETPHPYVQLAHSGGEDGNVLGRLKAPRLGMRFEI